MVVMPWLLNLSFLIRAIMPISVADFSCKMFGANEAMEDFKGR